jgi:hypothetical protein
MGIRPVALSGPHFTLDGEGGERRLGGDGAIENQKRRSLCFWKSRSHVEAERDWSRSVAAANFV